MFLTYLAHYFEKDKDFYYIFDNIDWKRPTIVMVNCDSDFFIPTYMLSLYSHVNVNEFNLIIFDNSFGNKMNPYLYLNYGFNNICFIDNSIHYFDGDGKTRKFLNIKKYSEMSSIMHCWTLQNMFNYLIEKNCEDVIITDSDIFFKKNPLEIIDKKYLTVGEFAQDTQRIRPQLQYINLKKYKEFDMKFFDENRILGITSNDYTKYDTGGSFYEDIIKKKCPIAEICISNYISHCGSGSYAFTSKEYNSINAAMLSIKNFLIKGVEYLK